MKKIGRLVLLFSVMSLLAFAPAKEKTKKLSGDVSFLKESVKVYVDLDLGKASIDGLDSEEEFVEYKKGKEKSRSEGEKWERAWNKDKEGFVQYYVEVMNKKCKKYPATFSTKPEGCDYTLTLEPIHIETGNPMKYSSVELKMLFSEMGKEEEAAVVYVPEARGAQMGPMAPTSGYRVKLALGVSGAMFSKYYKEIMK